MAKFKRKFTGAHLTQAEQLELTGPVKQMQQSTYRAFLQGGAVVQDKLENDYTIHEKNCIVTYTEKGVKTEQVLFGKEGKYVKKFNEAGLECKRIHYLDDALHQTTTHVYFPNNQLKEYKQFDAEGVLIYSTVHFLNDQGHLMKERRTRGKEESLIAEVVCTYNEEGNMLTSIEYNGEGGINHKSENIYNNKGLRVIDTFEYTDEKMKKYNRHYTYEYNDHGDCILLHIHNLDGSIKETHTYTHEYDSEGKKIKRPPVPEEDDEEPGVDEQLETDSRGNWIKKTTFNNKSPLNIVLRDIIYFDDPEDKVLPPHPCTYLNQTEMTNKAKDPVELSKEAAKWIAEWPNSTADNFPLYRFYALHYTEMPSLITYTGPNIEANALLHELEESFSAQTIHTYHTVWNGYKKLQRYTLLFPGYPGYILQATGLGRHDAEEFIVPDELEIRERYQEVYTSQFQLLCPCKDSEYSNDYFTDILDQCIDKCTLRPKPEKPFINMIEFSNNNFVLREHAVNDNFEIRDLDINYGYGFEKFHNELMLRFNTSTKGLVLFHGEPGTGKTYYIRHLLRKMVSSKKVVIYMPPNMVDHLVEPGFMTFISNQIKSLSEDGNFCVLLIEDAEPLLAKRQEGVRIQGVTNLLNMTDGLLNDMLNLQIICTFNVGLRKLDSALLRPGRLIARKEFKALSELDANLLAQRLGIKHHFTAPATLGEIYALRKHKDILIHDVEHDENSSDRIDDLI